jgi:hypothetical protein
MKTINHSALVSLIMAAEKTGATFVGLVTRTIPKALKKSRETGEANPFGEIAKLSHGINGQIGFVYQNAVNNQQLREGGEGTFEAGEHKWATHYQGSRAIMANKKTPDVAGYLFLKPTPEHKPTNAYFADGRAVELSEVAEYLPKPSDNSGRQNVEREVRVLTYGLDSILEISIKGERYSVVPDTAQVAAMA